MKSRVLSVAMVTAVLMLTVDGLFLVNPPPTTTTAKPTTTPTKTTPTKTTTPYPRTTDLPRVNLNGKMFTLSYSGGVTFFPPHSSFASLSRPVNGIKKTGEENYKVSRRRRLTTITTRRPLTTTTTTYPTSTLPARSGVSVCLRYAIDLQGRSPSIFTLSPSSSRLVLTVTSSRMYMLGMNGYNRLFLTADRNLWPISVQSVWTSVCLTVDTVKRVAQVFEDSFMSIRKILPTAFVWTGDPVIDISGFDGQVTDIQVWDYPVSYKEIFYYMTSRLYRSYGGNVLTWSDISFSLQGRILLEDSYEQPARQPIGTGGRAKKIPYGALKAIKQL